jgi:hypothetical protein
MKKASITINPLHFEDLEPHRFEDLVRQLVYDFREWNSIEATGRSGSDEGFDVRARETVPTEPENEDDLSPAVPVDPTAAAGERIWLIQCKREKSIAPRKIVKYAGQVKGPTLHGVIFAAPCDFSKRARDNFRSILVRRGVQEIHVWGRAELEDMLFQPKNDHLLFAYFGISLAIRRRAIRTDLRSKLFMKRKAISTLGDIRRESRKAVLLRDATDTSYPHKGREFEKNPRWRHADFVRHYSGGIVCQVQQHFAYLHDDRKQWDYVPQFNNLAMYRDEAWEGEGYREKQWRNQRRFEEFWKVIPENNRVMLEILWHIPYEDIIAIDPDGDEYVEDPQIYLTFDDRQLLQVQIKHKGRVVLYLSDRDNRVAFFPKDFPDPKPGGEDDTNGPAFEIA